MGWLNQAELLSLVMGMPKNYCCSEEKEEKNSDCCLCNCIHIIHLAKENSTATGMALFTVPLEFSITFHMSRLKVLRQNGQGECSN